MPEENENREREQEEQNTTAKEQQQEDGSEPQKSESPTIDKATERKVIFSLCYLWGILFFLPLVLYKGDAKATRHANEGLVLFLFSVIGNAVFGILTIFGGFIGRLFGILAGVYSLALLLLGILGIVYVVTDKDTPLPFIGGIKILK